MKLLEKILVATDFGSGAEEALRMAVFVAKHFQSEIVLLHVVPGSSHWYSRAVDMIRTDVQAELDDARDRVQVEGGPAVETLVDFGVPFDKINRQADKQDANLIILGARETAGDDPGGLGSTAREVLRRANKPVWIVKPGTAPPVHKILCPVDFSDPSGRALQNAIHLSRGFRAELTVLTAIPLSGYHKRMGDAAAEEEESRVFERFLQGFDFHNVQSTNLIRRGKPQEEILRVVEEKEPDLLVAGSVGRRALGRVLAGGVGRKVARHLPCSMVTVRSENAIRLRLDAESTDIEAHFKQGHELLALGFPEEAGRQFRRCIAKNNMHAPAWEGLAAVHKRLGQHEEAKRFEEQAEQIHQTLYHKQIEAEIRRHHPLFRPIFGIK